MAKYERFGCLSFFLLVALFVLFFIGYFSTRTGLDGTFYRFYPDTHIMEKNEYVEFKGDHFKWYVNGKKIKDFKYDVYGGNRIKVDFGIETLSFSMSDDKNAVIIDGKEFRKQIE